MSEQKSLLPTAAEKLAELQSTPAGSILMRDVLDAPLAKMAETESCEATMSIMLGGRLFELTLHRAHTEDELDDETVAFLKRLGLWGRA